MQTPSGPLTLDESEIEALAAGHLEMPGVVMSEEYRAVLAMVKKTFNGARIERVTRPRKSQC